MVRITRVYTRKGDKGKTKLCGLQQFPKNSFRVIAIGDIDELNTFLGFTTSVISDDSSLQKMKKNIQRIQNELFELGAQLAAVSEQNAAPHIHPTDIQQLEKDIDEMNSHLPSLSSFVLPGGHELSARLHLARAVCRRAERGIIVLAQHENLPGNEIPYVNRLSDWLFVAARYANHVHKVTELLWQPRKK